MFLFRGINTETPIMGIFFTFSNCYGKTSYSIKHCFLLIYLTSSVQDHEGVYMLGEKLKELREAKGLVQRQVATGNSQNEIGESYT